MKKLSGNKDKVSGYRYDLFDKELNVRPWKANELDFYDSVIEEYVKLENIVSVTAAKIRNNHKNLKRKFFNVDIEVQEEKQAKKKMKAGKLFEVRSTQKEEVDPLIFCPSSRNYWGKVRPR